MARRPMSLQTRLMTAVIGFVSLILVIVAVITSALLGSTLERQLEDRLHSYSNTVTQWVSRVPAQFANMDNILEINDARVPGLLLAVSSTEGGTSGVLFPDTKDEWGGVPPVSYTHLTLPTKA